MSGSQILPSISQLTPPTHSKANLLQWVPAAAPAQPAVLLWQESARWCSWGGMMGKVTSGISLRASSPASGIPHNLSRLSQTKKQDLQERDEGGRWEQSASRMLCEPRSLHNHAGFPGMGCKGETGWGCVCEPAHSLLPGSLKRAQHWQFGKEPRCWRDVTIWKLFFLWQIAMVAVRFHRGQMECVFMGVWSWN